MRHALLVDGCPALFSKSETGKGRPFVTLAVTTPPRCLSPRPRRRNCETEKPRREADVDVKIMPTTALRDPMTPLEPHESDPGLSRKLGLEVALMIEQEFLRSGWPAGRIFGLQADIQRRFRVGRWALREAVRILEMRGSADMRRGRGGGLMIARPTLENMLKPCVLYLLFQQASYAHLVHTARILAEIASETICQCYHDEEDIMLELSSSIADSGSLLKAMVTMTGDPALLLVASILEAIAGHPIGLIGARDPQCLAALSRTILADKGRDVAELIVDDLPEPAEFDVFRWLKPRAPLNACRYSTQLAFKMLVEIARRADTEPTFLGSECEIAEQYKFSLESVRQTSRILEDMGVVECRLGRHGGLLTRKPVLSEILPQTFAYLLHQDISRADALLVAEKLAAKTIKQTGSLAAGDTAAENPIMTLLSSLLDAYARRAEPKPSWLGMPPIPH